MNNRGLIAGILTIISGAFGFVGLGYMLLMIYMMRDIFSALAFGGGLGMMAGIFKIFAAFYLVIGICSALLGILGICGGILALRRKHWGFALAGAIAGAITFFPTGVAAVIFAVMAEPEFKTLSPAVPGVLKTPG